jgi:DNA-binding LacI/PurR family transcriptional regulator
MPQPEAVERSARATIADVAAASGVSSATVSFVLNNTPGQTISEDTRKRVRLAARDLEYVPNGIARAMREGASRVVVLNVGAFMENNYSRAYIRGLGDELLRNGLVLLVHHEPISPESDRQLVESVRPRAVMTLAESYLTGREFEDGGWETGFARNSALQFTHLVERGHTRIGMAMPDSPVMERLNEVRLTFGREAARQLGLPRLSHVRVPRDLGRTVKALQRYRSAHPAVTALVCTDDDVGLRVLRAMHDLGLTAPSDLAVIGFDATEQAALSVPALTSVQVDAEAHGRLAARQLLGLSSADITPKPGLVLAREST